MTNMSYCRWSNTLSDVRDCAEHIRDKITNWEEKRARETMVETMIEMLEEIGYTVEAPEGKRAEVMLEENATDEEEDE